MKSYTPRSVIAGYVKTSAGRERETVVDAAATLLGTPEISIIYTQHAGKVWYLAAPAADFASHLNSASALTMALPGASDHEGDGAYVIDLSDGLQAVVVRKDEVLHSFVGKPTLINRFIELEGAKKIHPCKTGGLVWQFPADVAARKETRLRQLLTISGTLVAVSAAGIWLWAADGAAQQQALRTALTQENLTNWQATMQSISPAGYPKAMANLQTAVEQAIREKGVLLQFEHENGRASWTLNVNQRLVKGESN
ncbi:MAG: hypothetical protein RIR18_2260 [Pseudomonadota bacterium]|jgi:hypothetical protein